MKKALIICAAGMSSSLMAKKTTDFLKSGGNEIEIEATTAARGDAEIRNKNYDLYLISPQTKMYLEQFQRAGNDVGAAVVSIPFEAYIPIPMGIEKLAKLVLEHI